MTTINNEIYTWITGHNGEYVLFDHLCTVLAKGLPYFTVLLLALIWVRRSTEWRKQMMLALIAGSAGLLVSWALVMVLPQPVPQEWRLGSILVRRIPPTSLPSPQVVFILAAAFLLLYERQTRRLGTALLALGLLCGVLRVYCKMHLPFYLFGSTGVAALTAWVVWRGSHHAKKNNT